MNHVPLSVREGNRRKKFGWWLEGRREALAVRLAPWLAGRANFEAKARVKNELIHEVLRERNNAEGRLDDLYDKWWSRSVRAEGRLAEAVRRFEKIERRGNELAKLEARSALGVIKDSP